MSEQYGEYGDDQYGEPPQGQQRTNAEWAQFRQEQKARKDAERERDALKREVAFTKAGIPDTPLAGYFMKGYEGDLTPEAIREAATAAGLLQAQQQGDPQHGIPGVPAGDPGVPDPQAILLQQQQMALDAQQRITQSATTGQAGAPTLEQQYAASMSEAFQKGGVEGLAEALQSLGIPRTTL